MLRAFFTAAILMVLTGSGPAFAAQKVTADELEKAAAQAHGLADADAAAKITDLELTERLSPSRLTKAVAGLQGPKAQRALIGVADRAAFLALPAGEIPSKAAPDIAEQRRIMGLTAGYVTQAVGQLPHFSATRTVTHFESAPAAQGEEKARDLGAVHAVKLSRAVVEYRDGEEKVDAGPVKAKAGTGPEQGLRTWGVFGPIQTQVLLDAARNELAWGHWEQGAAGPVAVFRYRVAADKSHYQIRYCCTVTKFGFETSEFQVMTGYHGEISVDPQTGAIVRLQLQADLKPGDATTRADLAVEYAPVELGGRQYQCPARSVSISVAPTIHGERDFAGRLMPAAGPPRLMLNHAEFGEYHLFRGDTRILSAAEEKAASMAPDATLPTANAGGAQPGEQPGEEMLADAPPAAEDGLVSGSGAEAQEITASKGAALPDAAAHAPAQTEQDAKGFMLRLNARLVDVNVVALDKKGRPITGLKREDFEIYDDGVRQEVHTFSQTDSEAAAEAKAPEQGATPAEQRFSNREDRKKAAAGDGEVNTLVLVVDPSNLAWNDLVDARRQLLAFLKKLTPNQRVALYAMRYHGFEVMEEPTTDHERIAARLAKWTPQAMDLLNARNSEERNRQTLDFVHSPEDLLNVNGNYTLDPQINQEALDPKLRTLGSNPGPNALDVLVLVARHLAPIPGHKSVVWVTSDNALADWDRMSYSIEKNAKSIELIALRTQEAMNNAHASLYPLDASRLESNAVDVGIGNRNVQLTPTFQMPLGNELAMEGPEMNAGQDANPYGQGRDLRPGRAGAQMQQDLKPVQGVFRDVANATGGKAFRRSSNIVGELDGVAAESQATYLLGFTPAQGADGQYHRLTVKLAGQRHDAKLSYRTGYQYDKEPTSLKERFTQAMWEPTDSKEIAISAQPVTDAVGRALRVTVAGTDLDLTQQSLPAATGAATKQELWSGKLDIFLVQRDELGHRAHVTGQTVGLHLKPATYQHAVSEGLTFDQRVALPPKVTVASLRVVVVDVNSGRIGSVTIPAAALGVKTD
jgi:VWFA-related protein